VSIFGYNDIFGERAWYFQASYLIPLSVIYLPDFIASASYKCPQAMYPTLAVALVARETSVLDECASRARATDVPHGTLVSLRFAAPSVSGIVSVCPSDTGSSGISRAEAGEDCGVKQDETRQV
jgi:hypothetical protein